jgi:hypothetical protein
MAAAANPYRILSNVSGFPDGRYVSRVAPSWLKAGLIRAAITIMGSIKTSEKRIAFRPLR